MLGVNHQFLPDNKTPALLGFFTLDLVENPVERGSDKHYGRNASVGFTTYRALDPLLLSAVARYDHRGDYRVDGFTFDPGESFSLTPQLAFAVNHLVTLTGGIRWEWHDSSRLKGRDLTINRTRTSLLAGLGYSWSEDLSVTLNGEFAVSDVAGSKLGIRVVYKFDDRRQLGRGE